MRSMLLLLAIALPISSQSLPDANSPFHFQNSFWVNLHHFVRSEARNSHVLPLSALREEERAAWTMALDAYADLAKQSLIFDERLVRINNALTKAADGGSLPPDLVEPEIATALNAVAPIYRSHLWDQHRRANEQWIAEFRPQVERHAAAVIKALAAAYHVSWPAGPILVDLSCESGPNLAYTTDGPAGTAGHTVIAPTKAAEPDVAFEIVFHEASHTVDAQITQMLDGEGRKQHVKLPAELWHALIFYTTGEIVKRELGKQADPAYKPYAYRGLYSRSGWEKLRTALERDWQPYLDGKTAFDTALHDLVRDASQ
jgi:hypothetical protein